MTALPLGPLNPNTRHCPAHPMLEGERILFAYRGNDVYSEMAPRVVKTLQERGVDIDLVEVSRGSSPESCRAAMDAAMARRQYTIQMLDGTMRNALQESQWPRSAEVGKLDEAFSFATASVVWQRFGILLTSSPQEVPLEDADQRYERFKAKTAEGVRDLFTLVLRKETPDRIWIFTEDLCDHAPFYYIAQRNENPGEFLRECLCEIGYPRERVVVVNSLAQLTSFSEQAEAEDPILDLVGSNYVVMIGDRHRLHEGYLFELACHSLGFDSQDIASVKERIRDLRVKRGTNCSAMLDRDGLEELFSLLQGHPSVGENPQLPGDLELLEATLVAFGVSLDLDPSPEYRRVWLRFPIENFAPDLALAGCLDESCAMLSDSSYGSVEYQIVETLEGLVRARAKRTELRLTYVDGGPDQAK